jgi:cytochrome c556
MQNASSNALMLAKKLDDDTADITSLEKELLWNNCSACHKKFRLKK